MAFSAADHTFAVCAYKESPYLEECILSLLNQSVKTKIILSTSTPNEYISLLAEKYKLSLFINNGISGIGGDWNFAYEKAKTPLVTIAHQDDIYEKEYAESILAAINKKKNPIIAFCDYFELRQEKRVYNNRLLKIKRIMLSPLKISALSGSIFIRRRILSFGCPICCPSVTFVREAVGKFPFKNEYKSDLDWQQWERLSKKRGKFLYLSRPLMCHRIHSGSATSEIIGDNQRGKEDYEMFCRFWPKCIAKQLALFYSNSEKSNSIS